MNRRVNRPAAPRSVLYAPGDRADILTKAVESDADAVIFDLEDAVVEERKAIGSETINRVLADCPSDRDIWVRVANDQRGLESASLIARHTHVGISIAKVEFASQLHAVRDEIQNVRGDKAEIRLEPLVESGLGLMNLPEIAATHGVIRVQLGEADLCTDLGILAPVTAEALLPARMQLVTISAARGLARPIAPVSPDFTDLEAFRAQTLLFRRLGFMGRYCIHPRQVKIANEVFTPSQEEVVEAKIIIDAYEQHAETGVGAFSLEGRLVDLAILRQAQTVLSLADAHEGITKGDAS